MIQLTVFNFYKELTMGKRGRKPSQEVKEKIEYAKTHTRKEWAEHYNSTLNYANTFYYDHQIYHDDTNNVQRRINPEEFVEYAKTHYASEIERHFNICNKTIKSMARKHNIRIYTKSEIKKMNLDKPQEKKTSFCSVCVSDACANCCHNYTSKFRV